MENSYGAFECHVERRRLYVVSVVIMLSTV